MSKGCDVCNTYVTLDAAVFPDISEMYPEYLTDYKIWSVRRIQGVAT